MIFFLLLLNKSMKKKPTIHITGINILLQLLLHKKFHNHKIIYYVTYFKNKKDLAYNLKNKKIKFEKKILSAINKKFSLNIKIIENKLFAIEYFNKQKKMIDHRVKSKIFIENEDIVSNNLYNFFYEYMTGKRITFITEGISTYGVGKKYNLINKARKFLILKYKFYTRFLKLNFYPDRIILFQDQNKWTKKYLDNYILPYDKIDLLLNRSNEKFIQTYYDIFLKLSKKFSYYFNQNYQCFYPILKQISYEENKKAIIKILNRYKGNILIKHHGADSRDFSKIKTISKRIILIDADLRWFPGELFLKKNTLYCGYLSSLMMCMKKSNVRFLRPKNKKYLDYANKIFRNIESIISKNINFFK